jgi:tRNA nucleotidyltransferase/poly(A) polymerase
MREAVRQTLAGEDAWIVGGAVRDELLGRPVVDLDVALAEPERAARRFARDSGGAPFPLSERHGAWRVALDGGRTVDFTPLQGPLEDDLASRDFTINAIAVPLAGGEAVDPFGGRGDLAGRTLRAVSDTIFADDPLRLLRAARLEDELAMRMDSGTEELLRAHADRVKAPAGERILGELERLSADGYRRLDELGLLAPLGGSLERLNERVDSPGYRLVSVFGAALARLPVSNDLRRYASALLRAERPADDSPRALHRFRRVTEPWAHDGLAFLDALDLAPALERSRAADPAEPLLRGDELGVPPGPEIGRLLELIAEERAAGTISTPAEALELVRRNVKPL